MMILRLASQMCLIMLVLVCAVRFNTISCCHESDRSLLLMFKQGIVDPSNRLSSWSSLQDCCRWEGVFCGDGSDDGSHDRVSNLYLSNYESKPLRGEINLSSLLSLPFLEVLSLEDNDFERITMPSLNNSVATHNTHLLPNSSSKISDLSLSGNIHLHIDNLQYLLSLLPSLAYFDLSGIHLPREKNWVQSLASLPLQGLDLDDCNLTTPILSVQYANFSSLSYLNLSLNDFTYGLPNWVFNLSQEHLSHIFLSGCNLRGQIPDFSAYRHLWWLDLSNNKLEGSIPHWLGQLDNLTHLDLSNNSFHGSLPSNLLLNSSYLIHLDIRFNNLSTLPKILGQNKSDNLGGYLSLFMSVNKFKGQLPRVSNVVQALDLSYNYFSGTLSSFLCHTETNQDVFMYLDLSNNFLTHELPQCWNNWTSLSYLFLGNNQLVGQVPPTMGSLLNSLQVLDLQNNVFSGDMPWTFHNCKVLVLLNLEGNNFSGSIQSWIPQSIELLNLRSNHFSGSIPPRLCSLSNLIVLDLANNTLSGSIPHCLHIITNTTILAPKYLRDVLTIALADRDSGNAFEYSQQFMKFDLHTKGQRLVYEKNLKLVRSIDLSANKLTGEIPVQLFKLTNLQSLNLSYNYLVGEIPEQIGKMNNLESLDLSHNSLHGNIPQSMSSLSFLSSLNLSYNHFSGQIPLATQLQSFDAWSYTGNPELCGPPLQKCCGCITLDDTKQVEGNEDDDAFLKSLYLGMGVGFAVGFWIVCGSLFLNRAWRQTYFRFFEGVVDRIYVYVVIRLRRYR